MKRYQVKYERRVNKKYSFWEYASEIIEARGLMHVQKLAHDHLKEMKKLEKEYDLRVHKIIELI